MDSVILILVELGALFNYLIGEEDFPQREHFGYVHSFISGLFQACTFFPAVVSEAAVPVSGQSPWRLAHGAAAHGGGCAPFPSPMGFAGLHFSNATGWICLPSELLQQSLQHPARVGEAWRQGWLPRRAGLGGAVHGLSTIWLLVLIQVTHTVLHPGVPSP